MANLQVDFDRFTGAPRALYSRASFLTERLDPTEIDACAVIKQFIDEIAELFEHDSSILEPARVTREYVTPHSGMKTVVWQQLVDAIPVFEGLLSAHVTKDGELVSLSSHLLPDASGAAARSVPDPATSQESPPVSAQEAVARAAKAIGEELAADQVDVLDTASGPEKRQRLSADVLLNEARAELVWLPVSRQSMRLCWRVILASRRNSHLNQVLVDSESGEVIVRHGWTLPQISASYRVYPSDSPTPYSPGHFNLNTYQPTNTSSFPPEYVSQTTNSFTSSANSPGGWINSGDNRTIGNNVDARLDVANLNPAYGVEIQEPSEARPSGTLNGGVLRFHFAADPFTAPNPTPQTTEASNNQKAAVVNAFYWVNWMHDRLYELGFTEAAGNFQQNNFGRGGVGGDAILVNVQY